MRGRGAHSGNIPWVGGFSAPLDHKGVTAGVSFCAGLLRLSREE